MKQQFFIHKEKKSFNFKIKQENALKFHSINHHDSFLQLTRYMQLSFTKRCIKCIYGA